MTSRRAPGVATLRGGAVGALTAALAVAGHGLGGGGYPTSAALTLLVLCAAAAGALATGLAVTPRGNRSTLVATLAGGQLLGHLALSVVVDHQHDTARLSGLAMLAAHVAATAVCAALIVAAEKLYGPITRALRVALRPPGPPVPAGPTRLPAPALAGTLRHLLLDHVVSRRGPPADTFAQTVTP